MLFALNRCNSQQRSTPQPSSTSSPAQDVRARVILGPVENLKSVRPVSHWTSFTCCYQTCFYISCQTAELPGLPQVCFVE